MKECNERVSENTSTTTPQAPITRRVALSVYIRADASTTGTANMGFGTPAVHRLRCVFFPIEIARIGTSPIHVAIPWPYRHCPVVASCCLVVASSSPHRFYCRLLGASSPYRGRSFVDASPPLFAPSSCPPHRLLVALRAHWLAHRRFRVSRRGPASARPAI